MLILIVPRTLILMKRNRRRERRMPVQRDNITRRAMETMVSVKRIIVWILWLIPTCRAMVSVVRVNRPRIMEDQASTLRSY